MGCRGLNEIRCLPLFSNHRHAFRLPSHVPHREDLLKSMRGSTFRCRTPIPPSLPLLGELGTIGNRSVKDLDRPPTTSRGTRTEVESAVEETIRTPSVGEIPIRTVTLVEVEHGVLSPLFRCCYYKLSRPENFVKKFLLEIVALIRPRLYGTRSCIE